jgi:triosephosphate isomerase
MKVPASHGIALESPGRVYADSAYEEEMRALIAGNWKMHRLARQLGEILALPDVGGALVGGASLKAADFEAIVRAVDASEHP